MNIRVESAWPKRDIYQRRAYAAHRAAVAIDRAVRLASMGSSLDTERALRWMKLWTAFAASRHQLVTVQGVKAA